MNLGFSESAQRHPCEQHLDMYTESRYLTEFGRYLTEFGWFFEFRPRAGVSLSESDLESDSVSESDFPGPRPPRPIQPSEAEAQDGWP